MVAERRGGGIDEPPMRPTPESVIEAGLGRIVGRRGDVLDPEAGPPVADEMLGSCTTCEGDDE